MIPLKINYKHLCQIFEPELNISGWTEEDIKAYSIAKLMYPSSVDLTSETYSRDAERTADYELENLTLVNRKAKPEFTWDIIPAAYVEHLLEELKYNYDFKNLEGTIEPREAENIYVEYYDFVGKRTITAYLGQTINGTLEEYENKLYWRNFRIAFPER